MRNDQIHTVPDHRWISDTSVAVRQWEFMPSHRIRHNSPIKKQKVFKTTLPSHFLATLSFLCVTSTACTGWAPCVCWSELWRLSPGDRPEDVIWQQSCQIAAPWSLKSCRLKVFNGTTADGLAGGVLDYQISDQYTGVRGVEDSHLEVLQTLVPSYFLLMQIEHDVILILSFLATIKAQITVGFGHKQLLWWLENENGM